MKRSPWISSSPVKGLQFHIATQEGHEILSHSKDGTFIVMRLDLINIVQPTNKRLH